ncbi:MAG: ATP-binding cassette domain-containing protein [Alphaproteobacteria bacterium]|nr:ATP-binding cassette domain-containing protein [Alphaproteobacteria bacterium]
MSAIVVSELEKTFRVQVPGKGIGGAVKALVAPTYRSVPAVRGLSFSIEPGERVAFVGPNGAGKSTTIKVLSGILHPDSGNVRVLGLTPWKQRKQLARRIGTVFGQRSQLWYHLPASDTFELLAHAYEMEMGFFRARLRFLTEAFDIGPLMEKPVRQLSLGERMRCEIVASMLHRPDVLFLDEPTVGLDVTAKSAIRDLVRDTSLNDGTTVLLTSHDTGDMERVCDRVVIIDGGLLVADQPVSELRQSYIRRKVITLAMKEERIALKDKGLRVLESAPYFLKIDVDTQARSVESVIRDAMACTALRDITVEDPPMEDIIKSIYASGRRAA